MSAIEEKGVYVTPVQNGTALDHLNPGTALKILDVLNIKSARVGVAMNVESKSMKVKDIVFIEGKELSFEEIQKIALIGKGGTLNIIRDSKVVRKEKIEYPTESKGIITCINPNCISNKESIDSRFAIISTEPLLAKCLYCEGRMDEQQIANAIK